MNKICAFCGVTFISEVKCQKYCSEKCKNKKYRSDEKHCVNEKRLCNVCGKEYHPNKYRMKTCSEECAILYKINERKDERDIRKTKCPICDRIYNRVFSPPWCGNGIPRINCDACKNNLSSIPPEYNLFTCIYA